MKANPILRGIWVPILIQVKKDGHIDFDAFRLATQYFASSGIHGIYTTDTASEFYTMEYEEWNELVTYFHELTKEFKIPAGVGCTWTNQTGILKRIDRVIELGFHNIHLSQPYWIRLNESAQRVFWKAVADHVGSSLEIVVYSGSQGQFPLDGSIILRLCEVCPAIAGTKTGGFDALALNSLLTQCPDISHFVHEQVLAPSIAMGAVGNFSSLVGISTSLMVRWFDLMEKKKWEDAFEIQRKVNRFYEEAVVPIRKQGYIMDKALAAIGRCPGCANHQLRPPYQGLPDSLFASLEKAAHKYFPEFLNQ